MAKKSYLKGSGILGKKGIGTRANCFYHCLVIEVEPNKYIPRRIVFEIPLEPKEYERLKKKAKKRDFKIKYEGNLELIIKKVNDE